MYDHSFDFAAAQQQQPMPVQPGVDFRQRNSYGLLWVPATETARGSLTPFFNGLPGKSTMYSRYDCAATASDFPNNPAYCTWRAFRPSCAPALTLAARATFSCCPQPHFRSSTASTWASFWTRG